MHPVRPILRLVLAAALAIVLAACQLVPGLADAFHVPGAGGGPVVTLTSRGGLCPDGECTTTTTIRADGTIVEPDGTTRQIEAARWAAIRASIQGADWDAVLGVPFTDLCPTAFDGTELTWTFRTSGGPVEVASCSIAIDYAQAPFSLLVPELFPGAGGWRSRPGSERAGGRNRLS